MCGFILAILAFFLAIYCNSSVVGSRKRESSVEKQIEESNRRRRRRLTSKQLPANLDLLLLRDFVFFIYLSFFYFRGYDEFCLGFQMFLLLCFWRANSSQKHVFHFVTILM